MPQPIHLKHKPLTQSLWVPAILASLLAGCAVPNPQGPQIHDGQPTAPHHNLPALSAATPSEPGNHPEGSPLGNPQDQWVQAGRYRVVNAVPSKAQQDLLQVMVQVTLPGEVKTVQAAVQYLLLRSGYQLEPKPMGNEVQQLLSKPIPAVHRHLGPMALHSALETLAGYPFQLKVDPVHRQVSYGLPQSFSHQGRP